MSLVVENLEVFYGRICGVADVSFHVDAGEMVALVGANGAGKTTTLEAVAGVRRPTRGQIIFDRQSLVGESPERIVRRGVSLVPEGRQIFSTLTVDENLRLGATARRDSGIRVDIDAAFERFPALDNLRRTPAGRLSGGQQQQLAIARALVANPRLLMLDEPSLGLAPQVVDLVFETLSELRAEGMAILLVEQNAMRAVATADRSYVLQRGEVRLTGTPDSLADQRELVTAYLGANRAGAA